MDRFAFFPFSSSLMATSDREHRGTQYHVLDVNVGRASIIIIQSGCVVYGIGCMPYVALFGIIYIYMHGTCVLVRVRGF